MKHLLQNLPKTALFVLLAFCSITAQATIYYVKPSATGTADGLSWANAKGSGSLQAVISAATNGDQVWVMKGSYQLAVNTSYNMKEGVKLYGSFAGTEASLTDRHIGSTSADSSRLVGNGASVIYNSSTLTTAALLDGFFVTGGNGAFGGGMCNNSGCSPSISNCIFSGNTSTYNGGGMDNGSSASPTISNCGFSGNTSGSGGGGMRNFHSSPNISNCTFSGNIVTSGSGGGMQNDGPSSPIISNCNFTGNKATSGTGGGIINSSSSPTISNCSFAGNRASDGGGIENSSSSTAAINNCIFSGNTAGYLGGGMDNGSSSPTVTNCTFSGNTDGGYGAGAMDNQSSSNPTINNTIIWGNSGGVYNYNSTPTYNYSLVQGINLGGTNLDGTNTANNPLFVNAPAASTAPFNNGDYRLQTSPKSPAIDRGSNSLVSAGITTDIAGNTRIIGTSVDMGAYESGSIVAKATIYYVKPSATGTADGLSWANAKGSSSLQAVISAATSGDQVWVMKGSYQPAASTSYNMKEGVKLYGSFAGTEANLTDRHIGSTSADSSRLVGNGASVIYNVYNGLTNAALLDGFFVTGGNASFGGGMYNNSSASPSISNCIFSGNTATYNGGGMCNDYSSSPTISNCGFSNNTSGGDGGGMRNFQSSPIISNCTFSANTATTGSGGGIENTSSSSPTISNCSFAGNRVAAGQGGGISNDGSSPIISNCSFKGNSSTTSSGGGMGNGSSSSPTIINCIFSGNTAYYLGGGMVNNTSSPNINNCTFSGNSDGYGAGALTNQNSSNPIINNTIIWGNSTGVYNSSSTPTYNYSLVQALNPGGTNLDGTNTANNPLFMNAPAASTAPFTNGDYHLKTGSPAIDKGSNSLVPSGITTDIAGNARIMGTSVDLGAYEYGGQANIYYVKPSATGTADGLSWANAKAGYSLQAVISAATNGDQIWVMKGSYYPASSTSYSMKEGVKIYGSFAGTEASLTDRHIGSTSADSSRLVGSGASVIYNFNPLTNATLLDGFFVTGGNNTNFGGGMYNYGASPSITNCIFSGNTSTYNGGGISNSNSSSPNISNCTFSGNTVIVTAGNDGGGGMYNGPSSLPTINKCIFSNNLVTGYGSSGGGMLNSGSSPIISNCIFSENKITTGYGGGGMENYNSSPIISNCIFTGNMAATYNGGAMDNQSSSPTINNCLFSGNMAGFLGGGISNNNTSSPTINNSTFSGNMDNSGAGAIANQNSSTPTINNTIIWGNSTGVYNNNNSTPNYNYSLVQGLNPSGSNLDGTNASNNPLFVNAPAASTAPFTGGDYRLQSCSSPCINVGSNALVPTGVTTDLAGNARILGGTVDLGAYELGTLAIANGSTNLNQNGTTLYAVSSCQLLATVQSTGANPIAGSTTAYVWLDATQNAGFVTRHYQITPAANASTATGTITLYATQAEFDAYNAVNSIKLPTSSTDAIGIANVIIEKHGGTSSDGTGLPNTYSGGITNIKPSAVVYNAGNGRWEITLDVTGFSGFLIKTQPAAVLPLNWLSVNGILNNINEPIINWQVAEQDVASYDVEKSSDGRSFSSIGKVAGKGNGTNNYSFTEPTALFGTAYYRIKQTDANGNYTYSAIVKLTSNSLQQTISIYPNPANTLVTVNVGSSLLHTQAMLLGINGQAIQQINIGQPSFTINVAGLPEGIYILKMTDGSAYRIVVRH